MSAPKLSPDSEMATRYLQETFEPADRLALVLLNRRTEVVIQRLGGRDEIAGPDVQDWLRDQNAVGYEVYVSMNALHPAAQGRTKKDVSAIRHIYLDFDENGTAAVEALLARQDLPKPNYLIASSPGKWQVTWKVQGFEKEEAEILQKHLARETGADPAATDCARVLRLPGFYNHKYGRDHLVRVESVTAEIHRPNQFPAPDLKDRGRRGSPPRRSIAPQKRTGPLSQSERDWSFAKRALARGESPELVTAAIATYRRYDKHNPHYYAELTVWKAAQALHAETSTRPEHPNDLMR